MSADQFGRFPAKLERAKDLADIFEIVKEAVLVRTGLSRAGLMLGLAEMGGNGNSFVGGLYPVATNIIVMNRGPMNRIRQECPEWYKPYVFHILLHEYIHAIGYLDEALTRKKALEISKDLFGPEHMATKMAENLWGYIPFVAYPVPQPMPHGLQIELVKGFDRSSVNYIC